VPIFDFLFQQPMYEAMIGCPVHQTSFDGVSEIRYELATVASAEGMAAISY